MSKFNWVNEGVSLYAAGQLERHAVGKPFTGFLDSKNIYVEAGEAVKLLVDNFGKEKLFEFLKKQSSAHKQEGVGSIFKELYGSELSYSFFNDLNSLEKQI